MSAVTKEMADSVVSEVLKYVDAALSPNARRVEQLERDLAASKSTIGVLTQKLSATQREVSVLTRRSLRKADAK